MMPQPRMLSIALAIALLFSHVSLAAPAKVEADITDVAAVQPFALTQVRLTDSPFAHAQRTNEQYLLAFDVDRLLAPFLREAGLPQKAEPYPNWESSGLDGHIGGHYLSALSLAIAAGADSNSGSNGNSGNSGNSSDRGNDDELSKRLDYMLAQLQRVQQKHGDGYLGGVPGSAKLWQQVRQGQINADLFSLNQAWVPWYNLHKTFAGLRDAWLLAGREPAKQLLLNYGQWLQRLSARLSDAQIQQMLVSEHGGMNDVLVDLAQISGDKAYLALAKRYSQQSLLQPLMAGQDKLTGLHANTQIPKVIGYWRVGQAAGLPAWQQAATFFYDTVTQQRSVVIGGNSVREHFHAQDDFSSMLSDVEGPETCNTYNMLKLARLLFLQTGDVRYLAYYERASYNHILSSQHPQHGGLVYFTPMRSGHYRKYSSHDESMWCCVGSGIENHSKYGELIYSYADNTGVDEKELLVNLFIPSTLNWPQQQLQLTQQTGFPDEQGVTLRIEQSSGNVQKISIRQPYWLSTPLQLAVNGQPVKATTQRPGYITISQRFNAGDEITFTLNAALTLEQLPDNSAHYAVLYGPVALAQPLPALRGETLQFIADDSRMGHIAAGRQCPPGAAPMIIGEPKQFLAGLRRLPGELAFAIESSTSEPLPVWQQPVNQTLLPFFRLHDSRYQLYWPQMSKQQYPQFIANAAAQAKAASWLAEKTLDALTPGQQQPEVEHQYQGEQSTAGVNNGQHWRDSKSWFSYRLADADKQASTLQLTYFSGDAGRQFSIYLNDVLLADVTLADQMLPEQALTKQAQSETADISNTENATSAGNAKKKTTEKTEKGAATTAADGFYTVNYSITPEQLAASKNGSHIVKFVAQPGSVAGGIYGIRLLRD